MPYWTPEPLFRNKSVFVLGGGPSLDPLEAACLDQRYVIAVNTAGELMREPAVLFSRDSAWCRDNRTLIASSWAKLKITTKRDAARENEMDLVAMERREDFPAPGSLMIRYGISSGHAAVSLAIAMGARRIVLLGFDGRMVNGRSHWHDRHTEHRAEIYDAFNRGWRGWREAALRVGCEIVNATHGSSIAEFPAVELAQAA